MPCGKTAAKLGQMPQRVPQQLAILRLVEPAALAGWMGKRDDHRVAAESPAHPVLQPAGTQEALDRHLSDRDQHPWFEDSQLGVEPVRAIGDGDGRRTQVTRAARVAPREAAHQGGDVSEAAKFVGTLESRAHHPAVQLLAGATGERASRLPFGPARRLAHQQESRPPLTLEGGVGLGDDARIDASDAFAARGLVSLQNRSIHPRTKINRR
jgi:hypothetical protein